QRTQNMLSDPLFILAAIACGIVAVILLMGISQFGKGDLESSKRSNKFMQWRIIAQFVAVALILLFVMFRGDGG
ncbi:MAG: twin transmembrane helix small protein, partial [Pseudomonadota bacterium]